MKKLFITAFAGLWCTTILAQTNLFPPQGQVGIGTITPDTSAILEIKSTHQGILIPRMTKSQRDLIILPAVGLLIYQINSIPGFYYFDGTLWTPLSSTDASASLSNLKSTTVNESLVPSADNFITLGTSEKRWSTLYVKQINIDGDVFVSNGNNRDSVNTFIGATHNFANLGGKNVWVGTDAGRANSSGYDNTFVGYSAGKSTTVGSRNSFFGMNAGLTSKGGLKNTLWGFGAGKVTTTGLSNTFVGFKSGIKNQTGGNNIFFGDLTGNLNTTGIQNVYLGSHSGSNNTGSNNTCVGYSSGAQITTGASNTFIGANADATLLSATNSIAVGYSTTVDQSNIIRLGDTDITKIGFGCTPLTDDILDFQVTTAKLTAGGAWTNASDRKLKNNFQDLNPSDILNRINQLKIQRWHYIADRDASTHIGPVAQDFYPLFKVGDDTTISTIDPSGVALMAIQALTEKSQQKDATIAEQQAEIDELKSIVTDMQQSISQCCTNYQNSDEHDSPFIEQNIPNPFSGNTIIKCYLPSITRSATVIISSPDGKELKSFTLSNSGMNEVIINRGMLPVGEYMYSLVIDGKKIDSKRMVLTQ